jgi:hypothetical protein
MRLHAGHNKFKWYAKILNIRLTAIGELDCVEKMQGPRHLTT